MIGDKGQRREVHAISIFLSFSNKDLRVNCVITCDAERR